jgi:hypothetical protein
VNPQSLPPVFGRTALGSAVSGSTTFGSILARAGLAAGCGGAGSLAALALVHKVGAPAAGAGAVSAAFAVSAFKSLSGAIEAVGNLLTACIRARADAKATVINAKVRAELARAGLDPDKTPQAAEMQRALSVNPDLPKDRRPADETLIKLHGVTRTRGSSGGDSGTSPDIPRRVVPIRSDT